VAREGGGETNGAWIFVSHSHKDLTEVRRVRNALEDMGHNPLLFFLKSLENDDSELDDLICREIESRNFFLLCDSENARAARYVQMEVEIIKSLADKVYRTISLGGDWPEQLRSIRELSRQATVFISYARVDSQVAQSLATSLLAHDTGSGMLVGNSSQEWTGKMRSIMQSILPSSTVS
jgi:TIR domain